MTPARSAEPGRLAAMAVVALAAVLAVIAGRAALGELKADFRPRRGRVTRPPDRELAQLEDVGFETPAGDVRGWFRAPRNGVTIVCLHGTLADRTELLPEARVLMRAGYGVLLYDSPGHGESVGRVTWNEGERGALRAALDFVTRRRVGTGRIGVLGFSNGAMIAVQVAAADPRISALILTGAFHDPDVPIVNDFRHLGPFTALPAVWAAHLAGMHSAGRRPVDLIGRIAPRPILIVCGSADEDSPPSSARELFAAAGEPKTIWTIEGAHHGDYERIAGAEYGSRITGFYDRAFGRDAVPAEATTR